MAFRKKELFDITDIPKHIEFNGHWVVLRKELSVKLSKELLKNEPVTVDVTDLQWYEQERINHVINYKQHEQH